MQNSNSRFFLLFLLVIASFSTAENFEGKVIAITDGDTIEILREKSPVKVRLYGIDCPEKKQAYGAKAKEYTSALCFGKTVKVIVKGKDRYKRVIAEIILPDGKNLNKEILKNGFAWHFKKFSKEEEYALLEKKAKEEKLGLWADKNPKSPWEFRAQKKTTTK